jgi:hypothetical protein
MINNFQSHNDRRKSIDELAEAAAKRTPLEQIARLDNVFGKGESAAKERTRLNHMVEMGFGKTPKGKLPKDWHLGKHSKGADKAVDKPIDADTSSKPSRSHPKRRRKNKKDVSAD